MEEEITSPTSMYWRVFEDGGYTGVVGVDGESVEWRAGDGLVWLFPSQMYLIQCTHTTCLSTGLSLLDLF